MRTRAIIIKKQPVKEHDKLISCYTEEFGKLTAMAKGSLKKESIQAMHVDLFNLVDFDLVSGRATPIIAGAQLENGHGFIKSNLNALAAAYFFLEAIDKIVFDNEKDPLLWRFIENVFRLLDKKVKEGENDFSEFIHEKQAELLKIMGYAPNLSECCLCLSPTSGNHRAYSQDLGGALCSDCFLSGQKGIFIKMNDSSVSEIIFQGIAEKKFDSLNLIKAVTI